MNEVFIEDRQLPTWLSPTKTKLIPKNDITNMAKNYRPIACQNIMYKIYTGCINVHLQDHCENNSAITDQQGAGKKGIWGCAEQLLINKMILNEVKHNRRNLCTVWLDCQKAFDSVPHSWMIKALELAKVPTAIIKAIEQHQWETILHINGTSKDIITETIE